MPGRYGATDSRNQQLVADTPQGGRAPRLQAYEGRSGAMGKGVDYGIKNKGGKTMAKQAYFKLARTDGWDFYTGNTIQYRSGAYPHTVKVPTPDKARGVCSNGVIHASESPNSCFAGASIPCSAFRVTGEPVCGDKKKYGFYTLTVLEEIYDLDALFGWRYGEACNPVHPFKLRKRKPSRGDIELLHEWASVRGSVRDSVRASVWASVWGSVEDSVGDSVWGSVEDAVWGSVGDAVVDSVGDSVWAWVRGSIWAPVRDSVRDSVRASVWDSVGAYVGSLFPDIQEWEYGEHERGVYPFQPVVDLWRRGLVPSFDGTVWWLHSGRDADIVWGGKL